MASLDRAYGVRGAAIALGIAAVVGSVHGVLAAGFDHLGVKLAVGTAGSIVMLMAGATSARQTLTGALAVGLSMGLLFFVTRWSLWALMESGVEGAAAFLSTPPWGWPRYLREAGISDLWTVELGCLWTPALFGCFVGQERRREPA